MPAGTPPVTARHIGHLKTVSRTLDELVFLMTQVIPRSGAGLAIYSLIFQYRYLQGPQGVSAGALLSGENELRHRHKRLIFFSSPSGIVSAKLSAAAPETSLENYEGFLQHIVHVLSQVLQKIETIEAQLAKDAEFFLREIRHRHRNSLQFIRGSLTTLITPHTSPDLRILEEIGQLFDKVLFLYDMLEDNSASENTGLFNYFVTLFGHIKRILLNRFGTLSVQYRLDEGLEVSKSRATLFAMLFLELIMNTLKHGKTDFTSIYIKIYSEGETVIFDYSDSGLDAAPARNKKAEEKPAGSGGIGMEIIKNLISRAGGERIDDGSSVHVFKARFFLDQKPVPGLPEKASMNPA